MKSLFLLLLALTSIAFHSNSVFACQCLESRTPVCAQYWRADAVFVGQLREITPPNLKSEHEIPIATLHFIVEQPFRGTSEPAVDIGTETDSSCSIEFVKGIRYLIYAHRDSESNQLLATACSGTTELREAVEDLNYIRSLMQGGVTESIAGRVAKNRYDPVAGVKIQVQKDKRNFETFSNEKGDFSISVGGPGTYTVRLQVPYSVSVMRTREDLFSKLETTDTLTTVEYKVELGQYECDYREFDIFRYDLHATAEVSGAVLTSTGRPVDKGYVHLIRQDGSSHFAPAEIEADGRFKFKAVAAGEYFLVLNPRNEAPDEDDPPYPRSFYPNATDESGATKIIVAEDAKLENLTFRVGPAWKARTVSGRVVWKNGGPAKKAHLSLYNGVRYIRRINVDKKGRFSFEVYGDFKYVIEANLDEIDRSAKSDRVPITDKSTNLTLVLMPD